MDPESKDPQLDAEKRADDKIARGLGSDSLTVRPATNKGPILGIFADLRAKKMRIPIITTCALLIILGMSVSFNQINEAHYLNATLGYPNNVVLVSLTRLTLYQTIFTINASASNYIRYYMPIYRMSGISCSGNAGIYESCSYNLTNSTNGGLKLKKTGIPFNAPP